MLNFAPLPSLWYLTQDQLYATLVFLSIHLSAGSHFPVICFHSALLCRTSCLRALSSAPPPIYQHLKLPFASTSCSTSVARFPIFFPRLHLFGFSVNLNFLLTLQNHAQWIKNTYLKRWALWSAAINLLTLIPLSRTKECLTIDFYRTHKGSLGYFVEDILQDRENNTITCANTRARLLIYLCEYQSPRRTDVAGKRSVLIIVLTIVQKTRRSTWKSTDNCGCVISNKSMTSWIRAEKIFGGPLRTSCRNRLQTRAYFLLRIQYLVEVFWTCFIVKY